MFVSEKEKGEKAFSLRPRSKGTIITPGTPFAESRKKEMDGLLAKEGLYEIIDRHAEEIRNTRIFGSRIVDEIKGKDSAVPYEKSYLVIKVFND